MSYLIISLVISVPLLVLVSAIVSDATGPNNDVIPLFLLILLFLSGIALGIAVSNLNQEHLTNVQVSGEPIQSESSSKDSQ